MTPTVIAARNVNDAFDRAVALAMSSHMRCTASRNGSTLEHDGPVITSYDRPEERVLFSVARDANPFFHFFEPLWMLAGREDVRFPATIVKRMAEYSDDGKTYRGAYGYRWRNAGGMDQLKELVKLLRTEPNTRRAVLQMFHAPADLGAVSKDIPCNTHVYFKVRDGALRATVCCRSNDILWGAYGANITQFSTLQEYLADKVGVEVGPLVQLSDSWHVYTGGPGGEAWQRLMQGHVFSMGGVHDYEYYADGIVHPYAIGAHDADWDEDLKDFFAGFDQLNNPVAHVFRTPYFRRVVTPMWLAWQTRDISVLEECRATDWRTAAKAWLQRRVK
jgi:hypothetical protein